MIVPEYLGGKPRVYVGEGSFPHVNGDSSGGSLVYVVSKPKRISGPPRTTQDLPRESLGHMGAPKVHQRAQDPILITFGTIWESFCTKFV